MVGSGSTDPESTLDRPSLVLTIELSKYKSEIKNISAKLVAIGYSVDEQMRVRSKETSEIPKTLKSIESNRIRQKSEKRGDSRYFDEEKTSKSIKEEQKRAEKLKRQFNAFNLKPKYTVKI